MPKITIYERDNTGSTPVEDFAGVFVPGTLKFAEGVQPDANNCVYIPSTVENISDYIQPVSYSGTASDMNTYHMVQFLNDLDYGVVYKYIPNTDEGEASASKQPNGKAIRTINSVDVFIPVTGVNEENYVANKYYTITEFNPFTPVISTEFSAKDSYFVKFNRSSNPLSEIDWSFLNDKNAYPIKFITSGPFGSVRVSLGTVQGTKKFAFNFDVVNKFAKIATSRKDCTVLVDLDYSEVYDSLFGLGDELSVDYKTALEYEGSGDLGDNVAINMSAPAAYTAVVSGSGYKNVIPYEGGEAIDSLVASLGLELQKEDTSDITNIDGVSSRDYSLIPNCTFDYNMVTVTAPSSFVYAYKFGTDGKYTSTWLPISGVNRGVVGDLFTPDLRISKYLLDNEIITDKAGVSFNAIVDVRPYGYTIWGDRTLIMQDEIKGVQATSYMSLRNLVSDIARVSYDSAIKHTFETNNDVTWMNFKSSIVTLLDEMVSSGVLQTYKINRKVSAKERNTMFAIIYIYPLLPVENFKVYINLENADVSVEANS